MTDTTDNTQAKDATQSTDSTSTTSTTSQADTSKAVEPFYTAFADEELRGHPSVIRYKSAEDLARGLVHAEKRLGVPAEQLLRIPAKPDDKDAYLEIYRKLGAPEKAEDYGIQIEEGASDEVKAISGELAAFGVEHGLNKSQMAGLLEMLNTKSAAALAAETAEATQAKADCEAALKQEWGAAYPQKVKDIGAAVVKLAQGAGVDVKEVTAALDEKGLGSSVALNKLFAHFATLTAEPGSAPNGRTTEGVMTPAEAKNARLAMENDPDKRAILENKSHGQHDALVKERQRLLGMEIAKAD